MFGFYRVAAAVPKLVVAGVESNVEELIRLYRLAAEQHCAAVVFPELCITGYGAGDLFFQRQLLEGAQKAMLKFAEATAGCPTIAIAGAPLAVQDKLFNTAWIMQNGRVLGIVPKQLLPNYGEFAEKRVFQSGFCVEDCEIRLGTQSVPFGKDLVFVANDEFRFGVEICEDLWGVVPPSAHLALAGALAVFNPAATTEQPGKAAIRRELVTGQSRRIAGVYVMASAGVTESTTDVVCSGHALIADAGKLSAETARFSRESEIIYSDVDFQNLTALRRTGGSFNDNVLPDHERFRTVALADVPGSPDWRFADIAPCPLIPAEAVRKEHCLEVLKIQAAGLAKRVEHSHAKTLVIGVSGGLDSTLALLATSECVKMLAMPASMIRAYTLPGFGTTKVTRGNSEKLCEALGIPLKTVNITEACLQHFKDIGHDPEILDSSYENTQARERTQILMDLANQTGGMVIGTGDLSEAALGWCTYNGDHMSMYGVNASVPKTLIRYILKTVAEERGGALAEVLQSILNTPVSPELLPPDASGKIGQKTEEIIGPYELHDFFLYHFLKYQAEPEKILALALHAWKDVYGEVAIRRTLQIFLKRFFQQQFKRSCSPDGPLAGPLSLSPRAGWHMPSDAAGDLWLAAIK